MPTTKQKPKKTLINLPGAFRAPFDLAMGFPGQVAGQVAYVAHMPVQAVGTAAKKAAKKARTVAKGAKNAAKGATKAAMGMPGRLLKSMQSKKSNKSKK